MNRLEKTKKVPDSLVRYGTQETEKLRACVAAGKALDFKPSIYAAPDVKMLLKKNQNGKCAYCERYFNGDYGAVEHFRPKAAYQVKGEKHLYKPAYYWLAYDWDNLLYSCSECNASYKKNFFPLVDEGMRDIVHENIASEQPLLLNPAKDEIGEYMEFHRYLIAARDTAPSKARAEETIELFQLNNRRVLVERRKSVWNNYTRLCVIREIASHQGDQGIVNEINCMIANMESEKAEFTGMFKFQRK